MAVSIACGLPPISARLGHVPCPQAVRVVFEPAAQPSRAGRRVPGCHRPSHPAVHLVASEHNVALQRADQSGKGEAHPRDHYDLSTTRRYYMCNGIQSLRLRCRKRPNIRAERLEEEIAQAERGLRSIQTREDHAITVFVSGRITEAQLDLQRKFITERLESVRASWTNTVPGRRAEQDRLIRWRPTSPLQGGRAHMPPLIGHNFHTFVLRFRLVK